MLSISVTFCFSDVNLLVKYIFPSASTLDRAILLLL